MRLRGLACAAAALAVAAGCSGQERSGPEPPPPPTLTGDRAAPPEGQVRVLAPPGRFPRAVLRAFSRSSGCRATVTAVGGADEARELLTATPSWWDLVAVPAERARPLIEERLVAVLDAGRVEGLGDLPQPFRRPAGTTADGRRYGIGVLWTVDALLVARRAFPAGVPTGTRVLWAPPGRRRAAMPDDPLQLAAAALFLGRPGPFALTEAELASARRLVGVQRPRVAAYVSDPGAIAALFKGRRIVVALGPPSIALDAPGVAVVVPDDGAVGRVEALLPAAGAPNPVCAYRFLSFSLTSRVQAALARAARLAPVALAACATVPRRLCTALLGEDGSLPRRVVFAEWPLAPTGWGAWQAAWHDATRP